jgi:hypothetical protein
MKNYRKTAVAIEKSIAGEEIEQRKNKTQREKIDRINALHKSSQPCS